MARHALMPLLRTFGELKLDLVGTGSEDAEIRSVKPLIMLSLFIIEGSRPIERAYLADLLWGDERPDTAPASFRQALHTLRRVLGGESISGDRNKTVSLAPGSVDSDIEHLERAFDAGDLSEFLRWYRGPFLGTVDLERLGALAGWVAGVRQRWRERLIAVARPALESLIANGGLTEAADLARELLRVDPEHGSVPVLVADVLTAVGEMTAAQKVLERARDRSLLDGIEVPSEVLAKIARLDRNRAARQRADALAGGEARFDGRFVGRDDALAVLFQLVERVRSGLTARAVLLGPPGIGKSRVLDEFQSRLGGLGLRQARVRYLPPMRAIEWSALAEFSRVLCALPGAIGVSEHTACVLVALVPELRVQYPLAVPVFVDAQALISDRAAALADLLDAVADERVLVVLQDDVQWVDDYSRAVFALVFARDGSRVLDVRATRDDDAAGSPGTTVIVLPALSVAEIRLLLDGLEASAPGPGPDSLAALLRTATAGIPQLLMLELHRLVQEGQLLLQSGRWVLPDEQRAQLGVGARAGLMRRLESMSKAEFIALCVVALWRRPIEDGDLMAVLRAYDPRPDLIKWRRAMSTLEQAGYVLLRRDAWVVAHELVVEATQQATSRVELEAVLVALCEGVVAGSARAVPILEHKALLCGQHDFPEIAESLMRRASHNKELRAMGLRGPALVNRVVAASGRLEWRPRLSGALGFLGRRTEREQVFIGALGAIAIACVCALALMLQPRLVVEAVPIMVPTFGQGGVGFVVQPRIGIVDGFGRRARWYHGVVRVEAEGADVVSDGEARFAAGRAQFRSLALQDRAMELRETEPLTLRFRSTWWVRSVRVRPSGQMAPREDRFRLIEVTVNDSGEGTDGIVRIPPTDEELRVVVTFEYTAGNPTANYVVGAAPNWVPAKEATVRLAGLPRPVQDAWQTVSFRVPRPPPGEARAIIFAMQMEGSVEHLFSRTNWAAGAPVWGDGNDLVDMPRIALDALKRDGKVNWGAMLHEPYNTRLGNLNPKVFTPPLRERGRAYVDTPLLGAVVWVKMSRVSMGDGD